MEEQHKRELEMQQSQLERLQIERDMEVARARLEIYDREIKQENVYQPTQPITGHSWIISVLTLIRQCQLMSPIWQRQSKRASPQIDSQCQHQLYLVASQCTSLSGEPHSSLLLIRRIFPLLTNFITLRNTLVAQLKNALKANSTEMMRRHTETHGISLTNDMVSHL